MSGMMMATAGFSGGLRANPAFAAALLNTSTSTGIRTATLTFVTDGTTTASGGSSSANNWYTPTTTSIGTSFWVKCTVASGSNYTLGGSAAGTWVQISSNQTGSISNSLSNNEATGTMTVAFSLDGGTTTIDSFSVSFDVGYAP